MDPKRPGLSSYTISAIFGFFFSITHQMAPQVALYCIKDEGNVFTWQLFYSYTV